MTWIERESFYPQTETAKSEKQLFYEILEAKRLVINLNATAFMREFLDAKNIEVHASFEESADPTKPVIFTPNHYDGGKTFSPSTVESMKNIAIVTVSAIEQGITDKYFAWFIKYLPIPLVPLPGKLARMVQNAAPEVFDYIGVKIINGKIVNLAEMKAQYDNSKENNYAIGYFPEQEPTRTISTPHPNFEVFLKYTSKILYQTEVQIVPVSLTFNKRTANVHFGKIMHFGPEMSSDAMAKIPTDVMSTIAANLPPELRGPYA